MRHGDAVRRRGAKMALNRASAAAIALRFGLALLRRSMAAFARTRAASASSIRSHRVAIGVAEVVVAPMRRTACARASGRAGRPACGRARRRRRAAWSVSDSAVVERLAAKFERASSRAGRAVISISRNCTDWKPEAGNSRSRKSRKSSGVIVSSTSSCWTSSLRISLMRSSAVHDAAEILVLDARRRRNPPGCGRARAGSA